MLGIPKRRDQVHAYAPTTELGAERRHISIDEVLRKAAGCLSSVAILSYDKKAWYGQALQHRAREKSTRRK
jgi:hypothetical protein